MKPLEPLLARARAVARLFRLGCDVEAAGHDRPVRVGAGAGGYRTGGVSAGLGAAVGGGGAMLACQGAQDWLGLADYLEYELVDWLQEGGAD